MMADLTSREALDRLRAAGIEDAAREVRILLRHAGRDPGRFREMVGRRERREPMALILGRREFWSLSFAVSSATLIPRPESETLLETALVRFADRSSRLRILDLGTGTGALLLALLSEFPHAFGVGVDRIPAAAALAAENARTLGESARASFLVGDWADPIRGRFDLVLANPPYVERAALATLMPEVARFEPASALDGGADGLDHYRRIFPALGTLLTPEGAAVIEIGAGAGRAVAALAQQAGFEVARLRADLAGIPRAMLLVPAAPKKPFGIGRRGG